MSTSYWERISQGEPLSSTEKPCHDCAITTGFYVPIANELLKQPIGLQDKVIRTWYCHNESNKYCKGVENYIQRKRKESK